VTVELAAENGRFSTCDVAGRESGEGLFTRRSASALDSVRVALPDDGGRYPEGDDGRAS